MTNIAAVTINPGQGEKEVVVCVADGMASLGATKSDSFQKLMPIGDSFIMGTGSAYPLQKIFDDLRSSPLKTPSDISNEIMERTKDLSRYVKSGGCLYIVAGRGSSGMEVFTLDPFGMADSRKGKIDIKKRSMNRGTSSFLGSGSCFVTGYINGGHKHGKSVTLNDLADGMTAMYDFGQQAVESAGVNDKLQYGIVTPTNMAMQVNPAVQFLTNADFYKYISQLMGIAPAKIESTPGKYNSRNADFGAVVDAYHAALERALKHHSNATKWYTHYAEQFAHDLVNQDDLLKLKGERLQAKKKVEEATAVLLAHDLTAITTYLQKVAADQQEACGRLQIIRGM